MITRYLVKTDAGDVVVDVNESCRNALERDLLHLSTPTAENTKDLEIEVPLRAFGAKMIEIIEMIGTGDFSASPKMLAMMKQEKATSELARIERFARDHAKD